MINRWFTLWTIPCLIGLTLFFLFNNHTYSMDTDLYAVMGVQVPPNVLIVLDNSSSMTNQDQSSVYNPDAENNPPGYPPAWDGSYPANAVYRKSGNDWVPFIDNVDNLLCADAKDKLKIFGIWNGKMKISDTTCSGSQGEQQTFLQTGNYMNYLVLDQQGSTGQPRLGLAKGTIHSYANTTGGVQFGLMVFNGNNIGMDGQGGHLAADILDYSQNPPAYNKIQLFNAMSGISTADVVNWTPLAETLYEAMLYFKGAASYYNAGTTYTSPIQYSCQKNYVILITDGMPSYDVADDTQSPITQGFGSIPVIGDYDEDGLETATYGDPALNGSHYLDDVAMYLHLTDMSSTFSGRQNITVFTIGFNPSQADLDTQLLQSTAWKGGGKYFYCHNAQSFSIALQAIIEEILMVSTSFVAPTVPISQMEKTASGDRMYLGMFKPSEKSFWKGNIKKFGIATANDSAKGIVIGDIIDKNGNLAIDPETNSIYDTAVSYWSTTEDGGEVEKGGVAAVLQNRDPSTRKIYTYLGTPNLADTPNAFTTGNITPGQLGLSTDDERNKLINFLYGYDTYDEDLDLNTAEKRAWILGGILHSRPVVINYSSPVKTVIYAGGNDGMLHAFDDSTAEEIWAFIPPDLLPKLKNLTGNTMEFFVDGAPKIFVGKDSDGLDKVILICGERRGGNHYFALDITNPSVPKWLWEIHPGLADYSQMGQTWSTPNIGKIKYGSGDKWVIFIGGGYDDTNQDNLPATKDNITGGDVKGFTVYVVDLFNGLLIWKYSITNNANMKYSIPSDIARVDTNGDGRIDRLYVGDMGGQIWRFDISDPSPANWTGVVKCIFNSNDPAPASGVDRRKIFYPPEVSLEKDTMNYELLVFGTGDREHPKSRDVDDRLYTLKDKNPGSVLKETDLVNVTSDLLQTGTAVEKQAVIDALKEKSGWYVILDQNDGEKCLAPSLLFYGVSYYSTFTPSSTGVTDPCFVGEGTARLYAMGYLTGNSVFNFDLTNDVGETKKQGRSDRSTITGTAIPSGAIVAIIGGTTATSYIGIGGGVYKAPLKSPRVLIPVYWKQHF